MQDVRSTLLNKEYTGIEKCDSTMQHVQDTTDTIELEVWHKIEIHIKT